MANEPDPRVARLPVIVEVKRKLAGGEKRFTCGVLARDGAHVVVLFVARVAMHVHGVDLPAGTVTFGHFWTNRPYNVYHWIDPQTGATIGFYVNLSDETRIEAADGLAGETLTWRDLIVDVLMLPGAAPVVLDEDEIPPDAPDALRARIAAAQATVLGTATALLAELEAQRGRLWSRVAAGGAPGTGSGRAS